MPGTDLSEGTIDLGEGVVIDDKLRLGAALYLEEKTGMGILKWSEKMMKTDDVSFTDIGTFLTAMVMQRNPDLTEDEARKKVARIEIDSAMNALSSAFRFEPKNSPPSPTESQETENQKD